jgi:hypothetical protein
MQPLTIKPIMVDTSTQLRMMALWISLARRQTLKANAKMKTERRRVADRPSSGSQILHFSLQFTKEEKTTMTKAATIHLAQWRNGSLSLKLFINSL